MVDTLLVDHEAIYDPRRANDRLLLGLKGSMSEYEIDLRAALGETGLPAPIEPVDGVLM